MSERSKNPNSHSEVPSRTEISHRLDAIYRDRIDIRKEPLQSLSGTTMGPYVIDRLIGFGAFGVVYRATDTRSNQIVALKFPRPELLSHQEAIRRFESEARATERLSHQAIVPIFESNFSTDTPYIVSAYCDGPDLARWLQENRSQTIDPKDIVRFAIILAEGIAYAHHQGVIHRDIKPSNILLTNGEGKSLRSLADYQPKLTDFGLAKLTIDPITDSRSSLIVGTPMYMAPEQLLPHWGPVSERTDIYSFGILLFEMLEGHSPRFGMSYIEILSTLLEEKSSMTFPRRSPTPPSLRRIVEKCMEIDPFDRYQDFDELIHCLKRFLDGKTDGNRALTLRPFVRWARHPRRPLDACFFLIPLNLIMMLWMMINAAIISSPLYHGDSRNGDLILCLGIGLGYNLVVAILCSLRILGQRWGTWLALPMALLVKISVPLLTIFDLIPTFSGLYEETPFFRVANHAQIFLIGSFEVTALLISVYSDFSVARRKELSKDQERFEGKPSSSTKVRKQDTKIERP